MTTKLKSLTRKQRRYVDCYDGDIKQSAEKAGISYQYAKELHTKTYYAHVLEKVKERDEKQSENDIWTRQERQQFWTRMAKTAKKDSDKLKASELLGRSNADFIDKQEIKTDITIEDVSNVLKKRIQENIK